MDFIQLLEKSGSKRHDFFTWLIKNIEQLNESEDEKSVQEALQIHENLNNFIRYLTTTNDSSEYGSHYIYIRYSQLYTSCLIKIQEEYSGKIFDSAELMTNILSEQDVSLEEVEGSNDKKKKKKKTASKTTNLYTPAKDLACTIGTQLFESFGNQLTSLTPLLLSAIFKNLKKVLEKRKYHHATYMTTLIQLLNAILRNAGESILDSTYATKLSKLSKSVFDAIYLEGEEFPVNFISSIIEVWQFYFLQDSYIKEHQQDLSDALLKRFSEGELGIFGFSNDETRLFTAKSVAEILFQYYTVKRVFSLEEVMDFYCRLFSKALTRDVKTGCFESIIHFIGLCSITDRNFLTETKYLDIIRSLGDIFDSKNTKDLPVSSLIQNLQFFRHMHTIILPTIGEATEMKILFKLFTSPHEKSNDSDQSLSLESDNQWLTLLKLELTKLLFENLSSSFGSDEDIVNQIRAKLLALATSDNYTIRLYANTVFKPFLKMFPEYITEVIEHSLDVLSTNFKKKEKFAFSSNHGHALLIANLIDVADDDYVSYELIMKITVFATSFVKNNTTSTSAHLYYKGLICWILLIGLMNYKDEQYLIMQTSQLFLFWKVLLTHTFSYHNEDELYKNLEIRNHALTCLLTYLNNIQISFDTAKQISYLLTKCSNFNHSVALKSKNVDTALLMNENRILQVYLKIQMHIKQDFNSSLLILLMKNFSDPNLHTKTSHSVLATIAKPHRKSGAAGANEGKNIEKTLDYLLRQDDDFAYGLSSKISKTGISRININGTKVPISKMSGNWPNSDIYWYSILEEEVVKPIQSILSLDSLVLLYASHRYSYNQQYAPKITTSLIDSSMELFSSVFPYLNSKIQYSVIENLNLSMFTKMTTPLRSVAIAANVCVALLNTFKVMQKEEIALEASVGNLLLESIRKMGFFNDTYLTTLKSECVGLLTYSISLGLTEEEKVDFITEQTNIYIKNVVDIEEPYSRIFHALSMASVFKYNSKITHFGSIFDVILALIKDPHPIVHSWSLKAMHVLLEKHLVIDVTTASTLLLTLDGIISNQDFGLYGSSTLRYNYNKDFNSYAAIGHIVKTLTETAGPNMEDLNTSAVESFKNITISQLTSSDINCQMLALSIYENLATFKMNNLIVHSLFIQLTENMLKAAVITGFGSSYFNSIFSPSNELFPQTSSVKSTFHIFKLFTQLLRLERGDLFVDRFNTYSWIYLGIYPTSVAITDYFFQWLAYNMDKESQWFDNLYKFFNVSRDNLLQPFYNDKKLLRASKNIQTKKESEIKGEEEESITHNVGASNEVTLHNQSDGVNWLAKETILRLIIYASTETNAKQNFFNLSKQRIPKLIQISVKASTLRLKSMKALGLGVLTILLKQYSCVLDSDDSDYSVLEQQEAQITGALMPAFDRGTSPDVIVSAVTVAAEILVSNIAPPNRLRRISQLLITLLNSFSDVGSIMRVGNIKITTHKAKRKIELSVLNAWATIVHTSVSSTRIELLEETKQYWKLLVPLWIISLREYMIVKYENIGEVKQKKLLTEDRMISLNELHIELYETVWLNFVQALSCVLALDKTIMLESLEKDELEGFIFILLAQCLEAIMFSIFSF